MTIWIEDLLKPIKRKLRTIIMERINNIMIQIDIIKKITKIKHSSIKRDMKQGILKKIYKKQRQDKSKMKVFINQLNMLKNIVHNKIRIIKIIKHKIKRKIKMLSNKIFQKKLKQQHLNLNKPKIQLRNKWNKHLTLHQILLSRTNHNKNSHNLNNNKRFKNPFFYLNNKSLNNN